MRLFRTLCLLFIIVAAVVACSAGGDDAPASLLPTVASTIGDGEVAADESPRGDADASMNGIPPTWTPAPTPEAPPAPPTRAPDETYVVQRGDTLAEIAEQFGVDLQRLASANNIQNIDIIEVGQVLVIPR
jgi:nucleoid-associated protein YgaU